MNDEQKEKLEQEIRCHKAMKKGVEVRISDLEKKINRLKDMVKTAYEEGFLDGWESAIESGTTQLTDAKKAQFWQNSGSRQILIISY